ncbi:partial chlorosome envelope protein X, partial [Anaerolineae bacterium]
MPALDISETDRERHISYIPGLSVCDILATTDTRVPTACGGIGICGLCRVRVDKGAVNDPTVGELNMISEDELRQGIRLACQLKPVEDVRITIESLPVPIWRSLAEDEYSQAVFPAQTIPGSTRTRNPYTVAVDLGTTQIRVSLWNVEKRLRLAGRTGLNPQMSFGADVLT